MNLSNNTQFLISRSAGKEKPNLQLHYRKSFLRDILNQIQQMQANMNSLAASDQIEIKDLHSAVAFAGYIEY